VKIESKNSTSSNQFLKNKINKNLFYFLEKRGKNGGNDVDMEKKGRKYEASYNPNSSVNDWGRKIPTISASH